jgi:hypothetical protein
LKASGQKDTSSVQPE